MKQAVRFLTASAGGEGGFTRPMLTLLAKAVAGDWNHCVGIDGTARTVTNDPDVGHPYTYSLNEKLDRAFAAVVRATKMGERKGHRLVGTRDGQPLYLTWETRSPDTLWNIRLQLTAEDQLGK